MYYIFNILDDEHVIGKTNVESELSHFLFFFFFSYSFFGFRAPCIDEVARFKYQAIYKVPGRQTSFCIPTYLPVS